MKQCGGAGSNSLLKMYNENKDSNKSMHQLHLVDHEKKYTFKLIYLYLK